MPKHTPKINIETLEIGLAMARRGIAVLPWQVRFAAPPLVDRTAATTNERTLCTWARLFPGCCFAAAIGPADEPWALVWSEDGASLVCLL